MKEIEERIIRILGKEGKTQTELRNELGISRSYLSEILFEMEKKNLIVREKISKRTVLIKVNREKVIKIGILKATEYAAIFLTADDLKDLKIDIVPYNNSMEEMKSLISGEIDIACAPVITGFIFHLMDRRIGVLSACASGGSGIVYRRKKGILGSTMFSTMDIHSREFLKEFSGIKYYLSPEEMIQGFKKNEVQGISIWEPYLSMFKDEKKIFPGKEDPCCGFLIMDDDPNRALLEIHRKFIENTKKIAEGRRIEEAAELMSSFFGMDNHIILESLKSYHFSNDLTREHILKLIKKFGIDVNKEIIDTFLSRTK